MRMRFKPVSCATRTGGEAVETDSFRSSLPHRRVPGPFPIPLDNTCKDFILASFVISLRLEEEARNHRRRRRTSPFSPLSRRSLFPLFDALANPQHAFTCRKITIKVVYGNDECPFSLSPSRSVACRSDRRVPFGLLQQPSCSR